MSIIHRSYKIYDTQTDEEVLTEDVVRAATSLSSENTSGMSLSEIGRALSSASAQTEIFKSTFKSGFDFSRDWVSTGAVTPTINTSSSIISGVVVGDDDPDKYQMQGFPRNLLTLSSGFKIGSFPSGEPPVKHRSFYYTGQTLEIKFRDLSSDFNVYVDGVLKFYFKAGMANAPRWALIELGSVLEANYAHRIDIVSRYEYWGGLVIEPSTTIFPTRDDSPRVAVIGDSITAGTGSNGLPWGKTLGMFLNLPDVHLFGIGGSGYINNGQAAVGVGEFVNRFANVVNQSPDLVFVAGGINDQSASDQDFSDAVNVFYDQALQSFDKSQIVICSPFNPGNSSGKILSFRSILKAKSDEVGCYFIDFISPDGTNGIYTGTGNSGAPAGDGNADIYISSDGTHPNQSGHNVAARYAAYQYYNYIGGSV